jgi:endonuclease/exonuclease/phosphatase family metal-dependent hydrolase
MSFNIEWGGTHVRFDSIAEAIREARADIVGIQEAEGNLERLAAELGWYHSRRNYVISRFPLVDPSAGEGNFLFVEVAPGEVVAVASVHLPSSPSGADWLRGGRSPAEVAAMEREVRLPAIEPVLETLQPLHAAGVPVFLIGDFNAPSHADWTEAAIGKLPHRDLTFEWPVSRAVVESGFRDSFRTVHPDPVLDPGFTWWAGRPQIEDYNPADPSRRSRIDYVWFAGAVEVTESLVVGEADADGVDIAVTPWPSDHRAVLSGFEVEPAPMPEILATDRRVYEAGEVVEFTYRSSTSAQPAIVLERATEPGLVTPRIRLTAPAQSGTVRLPDAELAAGHYEVSLLDPAGFAASRNEFWILAPDALPTLEVAGDHFTVGEPLPFHWSGAPGNRYDWIGIFPAPNEDTPRSSTAAPNEDTHRSSPANGDANGDTHQSLSPADGLIEGAQEYLAYGYVDARSSGQLLLGPETVETDWPLPPGRYVARLLLDDGYEVLAEASPFTVTD